MKTLDDIIHKNAFESCYDKQKVQTFLSDLRPTQDFRLEIDKNIVSLYYKNEEGEYDINEKEELVDLFSFLRGIVKYDLIFLMTPDSREEMLAHLFNINCILTFCGWHESFYSYKFANMQNIYAEYLREIKQSCYKETD